MLDASCGATFGFIFRRFSPLFREKCLTRLLLIIFIMLPLPLLVAVLLLLNTPPRNHISTPLRHRFFLLLHSGSGTSPETESCQTQYIQDFKQGGFGFIKSTNQKERKQRVETLHNEHVSLTWILLLLTLLQQHPSSVQSNMFLKYNENELRFHSLPNLT